MTLEELERRNPEWKSWLDGLREVLTELDNPAWEAAVPAPGRPGAGAPILAAAATVRERLAEPLVAMPLLHACRRRWGVPPGWTRTYCPICGAWPGFAEACGVERVRYLRCVSCGAAWRAHGLSCVFCGMSEHAELGSLVPEEGASQWRIEFCRRCQGYLKTLAVLRPSRAEEVLLKDLETIELDLAARSRGYRRPEGAGYAWHGAE